MSWNVFGFIARFWQRKTASLSATARRSLYISLALHGLLLLSAGGIVLSHVFYNRESTFKGTPAPAKVYDPRKLEFKVKVSKQQRSSSRPALAPHLVSSKVGTPLALPDIKVDPKLVKSSFQPKFKAVAGLGGVGAGLGTGYGTGGFGTGLSTYNFFGIRAHGDRIAILVDVSISMVEDERGGPAGFLAVKRRLNEVVDALADTALFNVIVFADAANKMDSKLVLANNENRGRAKEFLRPYNTEGNYGLTHGNVTASSVGVRAAGGTTRLDLALTAAFQMGADTILVISDGVPKVKKTFSAEQMQAFQQQQQAWQVANAGAIANWNNNVAAAQPQGPVTRVWVDAPPPPKEEKKPAKPQGLKEGAPPPGPPPAPQQGHWEVIQPPQPGGGPPRPEPPPIPDPGFWTLADFAQHLSMLYDVTYKPEGRKPPQIHSIGYQIDKEGNHFLRELARMYHGEYRRVAKLQ